MRNTYDEGPFSFLWEVAHDGYHWDDLVRVQSGADTESGIGDRAEQDDPYLVGPTAMGVPHAVRRYAPLNDPNLHRRLARTDPTEAGILAFANEYGPLTRDQALYNPTLKSHALFVGESLTDWQQEIAKIAHLIGVWDLVQHEAAGQLGRLVKWRSNPAGVVMEVDDDVLGTVLRIIAGEDDPLTSQLLQRWRFGSVIEPARFYVHSEVNERLRGHVSPIVSPFRRGEIHHQPDSLIAAIYTTFAMELSGRTRPAASCPVCGRYFIPTHGRQKSCSPSCRRRKWNLKESARRRGQNARAH